MKYFLDTEFIEKPGSIQLISLGLICEDGREYKAISNQYHYSDASVWVKKNVILPLYLSTVHGDQRNHNEAGYFHRVYGKPPHQIRTELIEFCQGPDIQFYGYYADYDWVVFCWCFGTMMDLPKGFPMYCRDLKQMMDENNLGKEWKDRYCPEPENAHDALADAIWNRKLYFLLESTI